MATFRSRLPFAENYRVLQRSNFQSHNFAPRSTPAGQIRPAGGLARPGTRFGGGSVLGRRIAVEISMKSIGRLRWVVDNDRQDLADHEAGRLSCRDGEEDAEQESATERILKNLALIRAYEAKAD